MKYPPSGRRLLFAQLDYHDLLIGDPAIFEAVTGAHVEHIDITRQLGSRERNRRIDPPANVVGPNCWLPAATENPPERSPAIRTEISIGTLTVNRGVEPLLVPTMTGVFG